MELCFQPVFALLNVPSDPLFRSSLLRRPPLAEDASFLNPFFTTALTHQLYSHFQWWITAAFVLHTLTSFRTIKPKNCFLGPFQPSFHVFVSLSLFSSLLIRDLMASSHRGNSRLATFFLLNHTFMPDSADSLGTNMACLREKTTFLTRIYPSVPVFIAHAAHAHHPVV